MNCILFIHLQLATCTELAARVAYRNKFCVLFSPVLLMSFYHVCSIVCEYFKYLL